MKISTILMLTAVVVILGSLVAFNYKMKDQFNVSANKDRLSDFVFIPLKGIEKINLNIADRLEVKIQYGEKEGISMRRELKDLITTEAIQQTLVMDFQKGWSGDVHMDGPDIVITTKKLSALFADPYHKWGDADIQMPHLTNKTTVTGYQLDQLAVHVGRLAIVSLNHMTINTLVAEVGDKKEGNAELILSLVKIGTARLNVPGSSRVILNDPTIVKTDYTISDSATVSLRGKVLQLIK